MATIWSELFNPSKHHDRMPGVPGVPRRKAVSKSVETYRVYFVRVSGFTFEFHSLKQITECAEFFSRKVRPSSRASLAGLCPGFAHYEAQSWHDRLPMKLLEERRRPLIFKALKEALTQFKKPNQSLQLTARPRRARVS